MAYITPVLQNDDIKIIETTDIMLGGKGNIANMQAQQLINRLLYIEKALKDYIDGKKSDTAGYIGRVSYNASLINERISFMQQQSDASAVVQTYADLQLYDTSKLYDNNIVKVLSDETHDYYCTYYRYHESTDTFTYIGYENRNPFYVINSDTTITVDDETTFLVTGQNCHLTLNCNTQGITIRIINTVPYYFGSDLIQPSTRTYMYLSSWVEYDAFSVCSNAYLPVGSVVTTLSTEDMSAYKGTWTKIASGYALMSCAFSTESLTTGGNDTVNTTPSASCASHALTTSEIPAHSITVNSWAKSSGSGAHQHSYSGKKLIDSESRTRSTTTFYYNSGTTGGTTGTGGAHSHGQGSKASASAGSGTGHTHTITFNASTVDIRQKRIYVYVWRRTA